MTFENKTIILTGASAGIGKRLAIALAQQGANLVLAARSQAALEETAALCAKQSGRADTLRVSRRQRCSYRCDAA
ncbi:SDR family NAD(P)-dependent oxidoreductase [Leptolyngbya sp. AN03gr2]|uniref:SDR family NAD(P)-dependent oxidoreductase n=1 Tax=unclassified Leptolyngbya TaxID=2650499 RepID=UPI003D31C614